MAWLTKVIDDLSALNEAIFTRKMEKGVDNVANTMEHFFAEVIIECMDFVLRCRRDYLKNL